MVDQHRQCLESMVTGEDQRFPRRTLLPLAIGSEAHHLRIGAFELETERRAGRERQAMPQAACCKRNIGNPSRRRVAGPMPFRETELVISGQIFVE